MTEIASRVSAMVTAYNAGKTIDCAIQSFLESNDRLAEIVVIGDGSSDKSTGII